MKKIIILVLVALLFGGAIYFFSIKNIDVVENTVDTFVSEKIANNDGIIVISPKPNDTVKLPITIEGYLTNQTKSGLWRAFEGEAGVVKLYDANDKQIAEALPLTVIEPDWMERSLNSQSVHFKVLIGDRQYMSYLETETGKIVIENKGIKDGDALSQIEIPIIFNK